MSDTTDLIKAAKALIKWAEIGDEPIDWSDFDVVWEDTE